MEEEPKLSTQMMKEEEEVEGVEDEEFYEKIEAPKFVDFTTPFDLHRPDDRYWFCLRVGCDRKHEEEIDPEVINKDFILRVMAARSPNVGLRKALNRKASSTNPKCPNSAPAKPSKPRVSRLALISSISKQKVDPEGKVKPLPKINSTPCRKTKEVSAKYLTTPRNKKCPPNQNSFRSVQNPKPTLVSVPTNRIVAKALAFHSPKKGICVKTSSELRTPLTKICEGLKRLEITSQRKRILGYSSKLPKEVKRDPCKSLSKNSSRQQSSAHKDKTRTKDSLRPKKCKDQEDKSLKREEGKEIVKNDSSDIEIDGKSRDGFVLLGSSRLNKGSGREETIPSKVENVDESGGEKETHKLQVPNEKGNEGSEGNEKEEAKSSSANTVKDQPSENEMMDNDDKENALSSDDNRNYDQNNSNQSGIKIPGSQETNKSTKKVARTIGKNMREEIASAGTDAQCVKHKRPKPTNPKPFRLRTDERGILREANLERKIHFTTQNENKTVLRFPGGNSQGRQGNDIQKKEKCLEETKCNNHTDEGNEKELEENVQNDEPQEIRTPKLATVTPQRHSALKKKKRVPVIEHDKDNAGQESENRLRKMKSPSSQRQLVRPQGVAAIKKAVTFYLKPGKKLGTLEDTSSAILRPKEEGKAGESIASPAIKSSSRERRPATTILKEPNFHNIHAPKSCTRKVA